MSYLYPAIPLSTLNLSNKSGSSVKPAPEESKLTPILELTKQAEPAPAPKVEAAPAKVEKVEAKVVAPAKSSIWKTNDDSVVMNLREKAETQIN